MIYSIIEQALIALPLIVGAYLTISLLKLPDFSIESAYLFGAVCAYLAKDLPLPLVFLSSIGGGVIVGAVVSCMNQILRFPFLLAAIITNGLFHGLTQYFLGGSMKSFSYNFPIHEMIFLLGLSGFLFTIFYLILHSQLGFSLAIYGNNPLFFHNHLLSTRYVVFAGVMIGHGLAGLSGFLFAQSNSFVDLSMNFGIILLCLTALMIGKQIVRMRIPSIWVPLFGILAYFLIQQSLLRLGLNLKYFNAFQALLILGILFAGQRKQTLTLDHLGV